uniref:DNA damage-binding protein 1 n=1 Tax=Spongospora subterranea TaxID=70186 RepID=A0A0H5QQW1_9EUKA|eukprot:CRZ03856.1 hypothetical protein [Spongospora subterranea]
MTSAFASIQQWQPSCTVQLACSGQVADRGSLVIARGNIVEIYEIDDDREIQPMRLRFRIPLQGIPHDMKLCRYPNSQYDSILLSFEPARLSRLDFNPESNMFETTAMHSYEDPKQKLGNLQDFQPAMLSVDPLQRCTAMVISTSFVMVWPSKDRIRFGEVQASSDAPKGIMASHSTTSCEGIVIDLSEYGVRNIKAITFLNGYLEPSLLILHEPDYTWAGRVAVKPATCIMTSVSINIDTSKHFLIATEKDLFYDTHSLLPLPMPIGGALVISCNMIIHYKQKIEFALSLNEFGDACDTLRVVPNPSRCSPTTLDRCVCAALSNDAVLIGSSDGELYILNLQTLGDVIRSMELVRITRTHIPSVICVLSQSLLFLGSKLGDSMLIEYNIVSENLSDNGAQPPIKRVKRNAPGFDGLDWVFDDGASTGGSSSVVASIRDSLFSIGPICKLRMGINNQLATPRAEMVGISGYDRTGAFVVLDDCVRSKSLASFDVKTHPLGIWSVYAPAVTGACDFDDTPMYLIAALENRTLVKRSYQNELSSVESDGFAIDVRTLCVANVLSNSAVVQVSLLEARVIVDGSSYLCFPHGHEVPDVNIRYAVINDPFIALLMEDGHVLLGQVERDAEGVNLSFELVPLPPTATALSLYRDYGATNLFQASGKQSNSNGQEFADNAEELETLLFGTAPSAPVPEAAAPVFKTEPVNVLCVASDDGSLHLLSLPDMSPLFVTYNISIGARLLLNQIGCENLMSSTDVCPKVVSMLLCTLCADVSARPVLVLSLSNGDVLAYNAFTSPNAHSNRIALSFSRFHHGLITRSVVASGIESVPFAVKFSDIRGMSGIFIAGSRSYWLWGNRDYIHSIAHNAEGAISAFCQFQNKTFAYCIDNTLKICALPADINYELEMAVRRIPFRMTPLLLTYHADSSTFALVSLRSFKVPSIEGETERSVPLYDQRPQMHLCINGSMTVVDTFKDMEREDETILCVEDTPVASGEKRLMLLSVGTGNVESEEVSCRGRLLMFRVHDTTPSDPTGAGYRYNLAFESKEIGPVSAITPVQGFLCVSVGLRVIMYRWDTDRLIGCAFYDADFFTISLHAAKNFVLLTDIYNSSHLLYWEPRLKQIIFLGKDPVRTEAYACEFLIDGDDLSIVVSDGEGNMRLLGYAPYQPDSLGGKRLLRRADIHIGSRMTSFVRIRGNELPGAPVSVGTRYPIVTGTVDGSVICLSPVNDNVYRRLYSLTTLLTYHIQHFGGLNPRIFRTWRSTEHGSLHTVNVARNIVDLDFLLEYTNLDLIQQQKMAAGIGTTPEQIIDNLLQLQLSASLHAYVS